MASYDQHSLAGTVAVVPGGTGNVGEGIVRAFLDAGSTVAVPSRSEKRVALLRSHLAESVQDQLVGFVGPYDDFASADALATRIHDELGRVDHVAPALGSWWAGPTITEMAMSDFDAQFVDVIRTHVATARAFLRLGSIQSYTVIAGQAAEQPIPSAGIMSMRGAALLMLRSVLAAESGPTVRINDLTLAPVNTRSRAVGRSDWLSADDVGRAVTRIAASELDDAHVSLSDRQQLLEFEGRLQKNS